MPDEVDGDNIGEVLNALLKGDEFTVCYDEMFDLCYTVPETKAFSWGLIMLEIVFWSFTAFLIYKRYKKRRMLK